MEQFPFPMYDQETSEAMKKYVQKAIMELHESRKPVQYHTDADNKYFKIQNIAPRKEDCDSLMFVKPSNIGVSDSVRAFFNQNVVPFPRRFRDTLTKTLNGRKKESSSTDWNCRGTTRDQCGNTMSANLNRALLELYRATRDSHLTNKNKNGLDTKNHGLFFYNIGNNNCDPGEDKIIDDNNNVDEDLSIEGKSQVFGDEQVGDIRFENDGNSSNSEIQDESDEDCHNNDDGCDNNGLVGANDANINETDGQAVENCGSMIITNSYVKNSKNSSNNEGLLAADSDNRIVANANIYSTISNNAESYNRVISCQSWNKSDNPVIENIGSKIVTEVRSADPLTSVPLDAPPVPIPFTVHMSRNAVGKKKKVQPKELVRSRKRPGNQLRRISKRMGKPFTRAYKRWNKRTNKYSRMRLSDDEFENQNLLNDEFQQLQEDRGWTPPRSPIFASRLSTHFPTTTVQGRHMSQQVRVIDVEEGFGRKQNSQNLYQEIMISRNEADPVKYIEDEFENFDRKRTPSKKQMPLLIGCSNFSKGKAVLDMTKKIKRQIRRAPKKLRRRCAEKLNRSNNALRAPMKNHHQNENLMNAHVNDALKDLYRVAKPNIMFANVLSSEMNNSNVHTDNVYATVEACPWASHRTSTQQTMQHNSDVNNYVTLHRNAGRAAVSRNQSCGSKFSELRSNMKMVDQKRKQCSGFIRRRCSLRRNIEVRLLEGY